MICPACGCRTPDGRAWCDLCAAPLSKRPGRPAPEVPRAAAVSPELLTKLLDARRRREPERAPVELPAEFARLDPGERVPEVSPRARQLAWAFLGIVLFWTLAGSAWLFLRAGQLTR